MSNVVIVRGAGDIASGIIYKLHKARFKVIATEISQPTSIRRKVSFSEAIYEGKCYVEDVCGVHTTVEGSLQCDDVAVIIDADMQILNYVKPIALIDAIIAKKNTGINKNMANIVIGVGPGFKAPQDVDAVIETMRGHNLGKVIYKGEPALNTKIPGEIQGYSSMRVIHAPNEGKLEVFKTIGDIVAQDAPLCKIGESVINAPFTGVVRGMLPNGFDCVKGLKIADLDPRLKEVRNCYKISDKARNIAGGVLEAILHCQGKKDE